MLFVVALALLYFCGNCCSPSTATHAPSCFNESVFSNSTGNVTETPSQRYSTLCKSVSKTVIVMSHGRSGSTFITGVLSRNLIGKEISILGNEILGENVPEMKTRASRALDIIQEQICMKGKVANYTGFKWKPLVWNDAYLEALRWVAYHRIPVVYNYRNPIDVYLSVEKHRLEADHSLTPHCKAGDQACLNAHLQHQLIHIDPKRVLLHLKQLTCLDETVKYLLQREKVYSMSIAFEEYTPEYSNKTSVVQSWRKVFKFVDPAADWKHLNMHYLTPSIVATSSTSHRDKIRNYDEIKKVLSATQYAKLLN